MVLTSLDFQKEEVAEVAQAITDLSSSASPGSSEFHAKVVKLIPIIPLTKLFNYCLSSNSIPDEWKATIVSPLYKNKGSRSDMNNYRGISIKAPVSKIFEKLLTIQITNYFDNKDLFFNWAT